jgi:hypothetical protein
MYKKNMALLKNQRSRVEYINIFRFLWSWLSYKNDMPHRVFSIKQSFKGLENYSVKTFTDLDRIVFIYLFSTQIKKTILSTTENLSI